MINCEKGTKRIVIFRKRIERKRSLQWKRRGRRKASRDFIQFLLKFPRWVSKQFLAPWWGLKQKERKKEREKKEKRSSCGENKQSFSLLNPVLSSENYFLSAIQISPFEIKSGWIFFFMASFYIQSEKKEFYFFSTTRYNCLRYCIYLMSLLVVLSCFSFFPSIQKEFQRRICIIFLLRQNLRIWTDFQVASR